MSGPQRKTPDWWSLTLRLLHPVPVFFIVTALSALVYVVPDLRQSYDSGITSLFGRTTFFLNLLLPLVTGLIAAVGVHFGLSDLRRKVIQSRGQRATGEVYTPDDRSRAIVRNLPTAAVTFDLDGKVTFLNPAASDFFNVPHPGDHEAIEHFIRSIGFGTTLSEVLGGSTVTLEKTGTLPGGIETERTWRVTGIPVTRQGEVIEALLLIEDRTPFRLLEDELIRSEDRYRNIFNHAPCGIFFTDSQGYYLDANPAALEMLGYSLEELTTLTTRELSADSDRRLRRLRESPGWIEEETRYLRKDGKVVEAHLQASSYQSGSDTYFIGIVKDVTARKDLERSLSAAKARLKAVLSLESRPLLLLDSKNRIANLNSAAASLLACSSEKLMGIPLEDLIQGDPPPLQDTSSAHSSPCVFHIPEGPLMNLSVIRLPLGDSANSGSLLLLSGGPQPVSNRK